MSQERRQKVISKPRQDHLRTEIPSNQTGANPAIRLSRTVGSKAKAIASVWIKLKQDGVRGKRATKALEAGQ